MAGGTQEAGALADTCSLHAGGAGPPRERLGVASGLFLCVLG